MLVQRLRCAAAVGSLCCWQCLAFDFSRRAAEVNNTIDGAFLTIRGERIPFGSLRRESNDIARGDVDVFNFANEQEEEEEGIAHVPEQDKLMSRGTVTSRFGCDAGVENIVISSELAVDGANVDFRALNFAIDVNEERDAGDIADNIIGAAGNVAEAVRDFIGNDERRLQGAGAEEMADEEDRGQRVRIVDFSFTAQICHEEPVGKFLQNATKCQVKPSASENVNPLDISVEDSETMDMNGLTLYSEHPGDAPLSLLYRCKVAGLVLVHMSFNVQIGDTFADQPICLRWLKRCENTWHNLSVLDDDSVSLVRDGIVAEGSELFRGPVLPSEVATLFRMSAIGSLNLDRPFVYVEDKTDILDVDLLGSYNEWAAFELTPSYDTFSVEYHCLKKGVATVVMQLSKPDFDASIVVFRWTKSCSGKESKGEAATNLKVLVGSATYQNKTEGVRAGLVLPGFARPCGQKRTSKLKGAAEVAASRVAPGAACVDRRPSFIVPRRDKTTTIELVPMVKGTDFPTFSPVPVVSFNTKKLKVVISDHKDVLAPNKDAKKITLKYICFKDSSSNVTLTLYMPGHPPVDVSWQKRCSMPVVHDSKAVPLPEYGPLVATILIACLLCAGGGIVMFACRFVGASAKGSKAEVVKAGELASMVGNSESGSVTWHE